MRYRILGTNCKKCVTILAKISAIYAVKKTKTVWEILIHSLRTVSSDKFITSANASSPQMTIQYFLFQIPDTSVSLTSPTSCVPLIPRLSVPSIFPFLPRFRKQSLRTIFFFQFKPYLILFLQIASPCIFKLKENKTFFGSRQTQKYDPILQKYYLHCVAPRS